MSSPPRIVLGPQRLLPLAGRELDALGVLDEPDAYAAVITAGWQERESEDDELKEACGGRVKNLNLYARWEEIMREDPDLATAHRARQDTLRRLQELYRLRLTSAKSVVEQLLATHAPEELLEPEIEAAIDAIRRVDAHHLVRIRAIRSAFDRAQTPLERPAVRRHVEELAELVGAAGAVLLAGGHVAVLLNRLQLFGFESLLADKPVIAWSAGAMALSDRVVLFHDAPPQGMGHAEVFDEGLGLIQGVVVLPHARTRLRLGDTPRVSLLARRFHPSTCLALDEGERLGWPDGVPGAPPSARRLRLDGKVEPIGETAKSTFRVGLFDDSAGADSHVVDLL